MKVGQYAKALVPLLLAVAYGVQAALGDDKVTNTEWLGIVILLLNAIGVASVPNAKQSEPRVP